MKFLLYLFFSVCTFSAFSQTDTIIAYDVRSKTIETILPVDFDETIEFDSTPSQVGTFENAISLPFTLPKNNLYDNSAFTRLEPADQFFDLNTYPIRTAMRMFRYKNDSLQGGCSGILISENIVLIAAHCIYSSSCSIDSTGKINCINKWVNDSIFISPAFNNAMDQELLPNSFVRKYYIFKNYYDKFNHDIALLELDKPIGKQLGWLGIAFSADTNFYKNRIFHKLSYPGTVDPDDSTKIYNGDTLYYNYGLINPHQSTYPQTEDIYVHNVSGIPGQSGSSLFYNEDGQCYSVGVQKYSHNYGHTAITNKIFYQFRNILENKFANIENSEQLKATAKVYPNPFSTFGIIEFENPNEEHYSIEIYNSNGIKVWCKTGIKAQSIRIERENMTKGLYLFQIKNDKKQITKGKFMII